MNTVKPHKSLGRSIIVPTALIICAVIAAVSLCGSNIATPNISPDELVQQAIDNLLAAESLTYHTESQLFINGDTTRLGSIDGEINSGDFHAAGEMLGAPLNIYQLGSVTWRQDTITEQWLKTEDGRLLTENALLNEIDPRAAFALTGFTDAAETDTETINGEKCRIITFHPQTESGYYEKYFDDLTYTLWIAMKDQRICRADITAAASSGTQNSELCITAEFSNYNTTPPIEPPAFN